VADIIRESEVNTPHFGGREMHWPHWAGGGRSGGRLSINHASRNAKKQVQAQGHFDQQWHGNALNEKYCTWSIRINWLPPGCWNLLWKLRGMSFIYCGRGCLPSVPSPPGLGRHTAGARPSRATHQPAAGLCTRTAGFPRLRVVSDLRAASVPLSHL